MVFALGTTHVLKLVAEPYASEVEREVSVLPRLAGRLPLPVPEVVAHGTRDGWAFVALTRLPGEPVMEMRAELSRAELAEVLAAIGRALGALHALSLPRARSTDPSFAALLEARAAELPEEQRRLGLAAALADELPALLPRALATLGEAAPVLLHGDCTVENVLVARRAASGLLDFGHAHEGDPAYDLVAPGLGLARGDAELQRALFAGWNETRGASGDAAATLRERLHAATLLHRFGDLRGELERLPGPPPSTCDEAFARLWPGLS